MKFKVLFWKKVDELVWSSRERMGREGNLKVINGH